MAARGGASSTIAERYAGALFELARAQNDVANIERGLDRFQAALRSSPDLRTLVRSPVISSSGQRAGLTAILARLGLTGLVRDFLLTLSKNRRLFAVDDIIKVFKQLSSRERGEVVSRDDLIATCWGGRVVGEDAIQRAVALVRKLGAKSGAFSI